MEVSKLQGLCAEMLFIKSEIEMLDAKKKDFNEVLTKLKAEAVEHLEQHDLKSFDHGGGKIGITERRSVKMEDKYMFFKWLTERGMLEEVVNVASPRLNKIYKDELAAAQDNSDIDFLTNGLPGVSAPNVFTDIRFYK